MLREKENFTNYKHTAEGMLVSETEDKKSTPYLSAHEVNSYIQSRIDYLENKIKDVENGLKDSSAFDYWKKDCQRKIDTYTEIVIELKKLRNKIG